MKTTKSRSLLIRHGHIWTGNADFIGDIYIEAGKITALGVDLAGIYRADDVVDADGLYVLPGGVDPHTHLELPVMGTFSADDFETGTLAALHGGTTCIIDLAMQSQGGTLSDGISRWHEKARHKAVCDYSFHCGIVDMNLAVCLEMAEVVYKQGIPSFKVFMAYDDLMLDEASLSAVLNESGKLGGMVCVHAERGRMINKLVQECKQTGRLSPKYHPYVHPIKAESDAADFIIRRAALSGALLYIVHTTCGEVLDRVYDCLTLSPRVFVETCPQYLLLDDRLYDLPGFESAKYVMSPPLRPKKEQEALWFGLNAGYIQTVGTDHCPFNFNGQKDKGKDDFTRIPNGAGGIQHRLELLFSEGVLQNRITMNRFIEVTAVNPAAIFGLTQKGSIAPGKDADIVLFDPEETHVISAATHHHNVDYSIYEGRQVTGRVKTVIAGGKVVIRDNRAEDLQPGAGRFLKRRAGTQCTRSTG